MNLASWLVSLVSNMLSKQHMPSRAYLSDFGRVCEQIRQGDVVLVEGRTRSSTLIQRLTHSAWSHAALYIGRLSDIEDPELNEQIRRHTPAAHLNEPLMIESLLGRGTIVSPLSNYAQENIRMCRPAGISFADTQRVIHYAANRLGNTYNLRQFFDLGRFLVRSHFIPARWHSSLFEEDRGRATQEICSSLIAKAFHSVRFPILPQMSEDHPYHYQLVERNVKLFTPCDFDYSPYFNIIKYPIFLLSEHVPHYNDLPWKPDAEMSNE